MIRSLLCFAVLALLAGAPVLADDTEGTDDGWQFDLGLYLWASNVSVDVGPKEIDAEFKDLIDKIETAVALHFEAHRGQFGILGDIELIELAENQTFVLHPSLPGVRLDLVVDLSIYEVGGFWRPTGGQGFDLIAGIRYVEIGDRLTLTLPGLGGGSGSSNRIQAADSSVLAPYIGGRFNTSFTRHIGITVRADIGGGEADLLWNALAALRVTLGEKGHSNLLFGYRQMEIELNDDYLVSQFSMSGPFAAYVYAW